MAEPDEDRRIKTVLPALILIMLSLGIGSLGIHCSETIAHPRDPEVVHRAVVSIGVWPALAVIGLMTLAIVLSPLPSAPIGLAARTAYGDTLGTLYALAGAETAVLAPFAIARLAGQAAVHRWLGRDGTLRLQRSQRTLRAIVFITRLMPFVSFDALSHAAGRTPLSVWRFALAMLAGLLPASLLLAHFGAELASANVGRVQLRLSVLGLIALTPLVLSLVRRYRRHCAVLHQRGWIFGCSRMSN